jgi:peptidoglycan hydrolase-like protein with peptidoglycan-binding domain
MTSVLDFSCEPYGSAALATYTVPGTSVRLSLRKEIAPLFLAFAREFHATVEHLDPRSCWGHAPRAIRGSRSPSRHWPGIAVDLNASAHPLGAAGTFTAGERRAIEKLLARFTYQGQRIFRWGGQYSGRKDEMHIEINVSRATALAAAAVLQRPAAPQPTGPKPATPKPPAGRPAVGKPGSRELRKGAEGADVEFVQRFLGPSWCGPADGDLGDRTVAGIKRYQRMRGLTVDGIVGRATWRAMGVAVTF